MKMKCVSNDSVLSEGGGAGAGVGGGGGVGRGHDGVGRHMEETVSENHPLVCVHM